MFQFISNVRQVIHNQDKDTNGNRYFDEFEYLKPIRIIQVLNGKRRTNCAAVLIRSPLLQFSPTTLPKWSPVYRNVSVGFIRSLDLCLSQLIPNTKHIFFFRTENVIVSVMVGHYSIEGGAFSALKWVARNRIKIYRRMGLVNMTTKQKNIDNTVGDDNICPRIIFQQFMFNAPFKHPANGNKRRHKYLQSKWSRVTGIPVAARRLTRPNQKPETLFCLIRRINVTSISSVYHQFSFAKKKKIYRKYQNKT